MKLNWVRGMKPLIKDIAAQQARLARSLAIDAGEAPKPKRKRKS